MIEFPLNIFLLTPPKLRMRSISFQELHSIGPYAIIFCASPFSVFIEEIAEKTPDQGHNGLKKLIKK